MPQLVIADALVETVHELRPLRSWADDAHVATQHVPELRQLIQPGLADEAPDPGDPVVVFSSPTGHAIALGVGPHATELDDPDELAVFTAAILADRKSVVWGQSVSVRVEIG